jgi:hypothetical protein
MKCPDCGKAMYNAYADWYICEDFACDNTLLKITTYKKAVKE